MRTLCLIGLGFSLAIAVAQKDVKFYGSDLLGFDKDTSIAGLFARASKERREIAGEHMALILDVLGFTIGFSHWNLETLTTELFDEEPLPSDARIARMKEAGGFFAEMKRCTTALGATSWNEQDKGCDSWDSKDANDCFYFCKVFSEIEFHLSNELRHEIC